MESEAAIKDREANQHQLDEKMEQLQRQMEEKRQQMNQMESGKDGEIKTDANIVEEDVEKLKKLQHEMREAEIAMKRLQQEQSENEQKRIQAENDLIVAETSLEIVHQEIEESEKVGGGGGGGSSELKDREEEAAKASQREEEARIKAFEDQKRVEELNKRMEAALMSNDSSGVKQLTEELKDAEKELMKSKAKENAMVEMNRMKQRKIEEEKKEKEKERKKEEEEKQKEEKRRKKRDQGTEDNEEENITIVTQPGDQKDEQNQTSDDDDEFSDEEEEMMDDMTAFVESSLVHFDSTTCQEERTVTISTGGTSKSVQVFITVTPRSMSTVFFISDEHSMQTIDSGQQLFINIIFDPTQHRESTSVGVHATIHVTHMETGREMTTFGVEGFVGPALHCEPIHTRTTWCGLQKSKTIDTRVTNISTTTRLVKCNATPSPTFVCLQPTIEVRSQETISVTVSFSPPEEGVYDCALQLNCEGGEIHVIQHHTICGNPLVIRTLTPRLIDSKKDYGHQGRSIIPRVVTIVENNTGSLKKKKKSGSSSWKKIDRTAANLNAEDGRRAVEAWHSSTSRKIKEVQDYKRRVGGKNILNTEETQALAVERARQLQRLENERMQAMSVLKQLNEVDKKLITSKARFETCEKAWKSAKRSWSHASKSDGEETIDHKRMFHAQRELGLAEKDRDLLLGSVVRAAHIGVLHANYFNLREQLDTLRKEEREEVKKQKLERECLDLEITIEWIKNQTTKKEFVELLAAVAREEKEGVERVERGSGEGSSSDDGATAGSQQSANSEIEMIHRGGKSQHGGYDMATRYSVEAVTKRYMPPAHRGQKETKLKRQRKKDQLNGVTYAPCWPGTKPVDDIPNNNTYYEKSGSKVLDFGLLDRGQTSERELMLENCTDVLMMVQFECSSSMFEFANHIEIPPHTTRLVSILLKTTATVLVSDGHGGRINRTLTVISSNAGPQLIHLLGHVGFPITMEIPNHLTFPPSAVQETSEGEDNVDNTEGDSEIQETSRATFSSSSSSSYSHQIPMINHSRYTVLLRLSGLEHSAFTTFPCCSDFDGDGSAQQVALPPLSVTCIRVSCDPSTVGPVVMSSTLSIVVSSPFQYTHRMPLRRWQGYGVDKNTSRRELRAIHSWYHDKGVLRVPRCWIGDGGGTMPSKEEDDMKWVAQVVGFVRGRHVLNFFTIEPNERRRQHGFSEHEFRTCERDNELPLCRGQAVIEEFYYSSCDVRMVRTGVLVERVNVDRLHAMDPINSNNLPIVARTETLSAGMRVHVALPIGTQVMSCPRTYRKGVLMKISDDQKTINVKVFSTSSKKRNDDGDGGSSGSDGSGIMCRNLPLDWLFLPEKLVGAGALVASEVATEVASEEKRDGKQDLPSVGSTVHVVFQPPSSKSPNPTIPWLVQQWRNKHIKFMSEQKPPPSSTVNGVLFLTGKSQKLKRDQLCFYHDENSDWKIIEIRNGGLEEIVVRLTTSVGYQWEHVDKGKKKRKNEKGKEGKEGKEGKREDDEKIDEELEINEMEESHRDICLGRNNFIRVTIRWLRKREEDVIMDHGWLCVANAHDPTDQKLLSIIGTRNSTLLVLGCERTSTTNLIVDVPKSMNKSKTCGHLLLRNKTSKEIQIDVIFESGADPFSIEGCNASGRLVISITPYSYMCFALQFQPMQRGKYQRPLTVLASTALGE